MRVIAVSALPGAVVCAALVALAACQDATGVGLGLLDDDAANPNLRILDATAVDTVGTSTRLSTTAGFAVASSSQPQLRALVGRVVDPVFGDAVATAYLDAARPTALPDDFLGADVTSVTLELRRDYTYGDTTASLPVEVRFVTGNWAPGGLPADTVLATGDLLATVTIAATDTVASISIPVAAMAGRDSVFTAADFETLFEGFALSVGETGAPLPGAVAGFDLDDASTRLRVATAQDTVAFPLNEVYTRLVQSAPTMPPAGVLPLRAGAPLGALEVSFDLSALGPLPLARAQFSLTLDESLAAPAGPFKRPLAREVALFAVDADDGEPSQVSIARPSAAGDLRTIAGTTFTGIVQQLLLGQGAFAPRFEVRVATSPVSLDILPVAPFGTPGVRPPRLLLTVVSPQA